VGRIREKKARFLSESSAHRLSEINQERAEYLVKEESRSKNLLIKRSMKSFCRAGEEGPTPSGRKGDCLSGGDGGSNQRPENKIVGERHWKGLHKRRVGYSKPTREQKKNAIIKGTGQAEPQNMGG